MAEFDYSHGIGAEATTIRPDSNGSFFSHNRKGSRTTAYAFAASGATDTNHKSKLSPIMAQTQMSQSMAGVGSGAGVVHPRDGFTREVADSEFVQHNGRFA